MIDLSPMKGIHVDPAARTLRAQGGVALEASSTARRALTGSPTTGGAISTTGIAGSRSAAGSAG